MARILLIESEKELAALVCDWLREDYIVDMANDGKSAMALICERSYDVIVMDWKLSDIGVTDLCRSYRAAGGTAAVLVLGAGQTIGAPKAARAAGADDFLCKPFQLKVLSAKIEKLKHASS